MFRPSKPRCRIGSPPRPPQGMYGHDEIRATDAPTLGRSETPVRSATIISGPADLHEFRPVGHQDCDTVTEGDAPSRHRLGQRSYVVAQLPPGGRHTLKLRSRVFRPRKAVPLEMTVPVVAAHQLRSHHAICRLQLRHCRHLPVVVAQDRVFSDGGPSQWPGSVPAKTGLMSRYT
jgi:hypothetical protein